MGRSLYHHQRSSAAVFRGTTTESQRNVFRRSEACAREAGTVCEGSPSQPHKDANRPMNVLLVGIMAVFIALSPAWAQGDQTGVPWSQLSPGEQQLLQRFSDNWDQLPPRKQQRLRNGARQWGTMTPEERQEAKQRFKEWRSLPPEQRQQLRERYQQFRQLPPERRESVRDARRWFRSLPPEQRKELREKFQTMSPEERRAYRRELRRQYGGSGGGQAPAGAPGQ